MISTYLLIKQLRESIMAKSTILFSNILITRSLSSPSYYHCVGNEALKSLTIGQLLNNAAEKWPDRIAFKSRHENISVSYSQLNDKANKLAASLLKLGLKPGDRIGVLGTNSFRWYLTLNAAAKSGLILAGVNPLYKVNELKYILKKTGIKALVTDVAFKSQKFYSMMTEIAPEIEKTPSGCPFNSKELPDLQYLIVMSDENLPGSFKFDEVEKMESRLDQFYEVERKIQPDNAANIQYTSGTTGFPKAATLTHFGIVNNGYFFGKRCGLHKQHHTICLQVPLFHVFGSVLGVVAGMNHGSTLITPGPYFSVKNSIDAIKEENSFTAVYGTPTMHIDLCSEIRKADDSQLREKLTKFKLAVSGGALCLPKLFREISLCFNTQNIQSAYGMSETTAITFSNTDDDTFEQRTETVGKVLEHTEVKVVDKEGLIVPMGTPGEVWFRSYSLMLGYWGDEDKTRESITPNGWMKSGDLFILDENGYGKVIGRLKDIINKKGENIAPAEIEVLLQTHPKIQEAQVYGCHDERIGEEVCASIILKTGQSMDEEEVQEFCLDKISSFKVPKYIRFVDEFPKTASGKVKKNILREIMDKELQAEKRDI